jgi:hypothetical protein
VMRPLCCMALVAREGCFYGPVWALGGSDGAVSGGLRRQARRQRDTAWLIAAEADPCGSLLRQSRRAVRLGDTAAA